MTCELCGEAEDLVDHHTNYTRDKTVPLCRSCHSEVHNDEGHPLNPDDAPSKATYRIHGTTLAKIDDIVREGDFFDTASEYVRYALGERADRDYERITKDTPEHAEQQQ